jgi:hypothetical protein
MDFDYEKIRDTVAEPQIAAFGRDATLTQPGTPTGPDYDPTPGTPIVFPVKVVTKRFSMYEKQGALVQENDVRFLMSTDGDPAPDLKGTLTVGSDILQVVDLEALSPGSVSVLWYVHCRK